MLHTRIAWLLVFCRATAAFAPVFLSPARPIKFDYDSALIHVIPILLEHDRHIAHIIYILVSRELI